MKRVSKTNRPISAESIAKLADNGTDISSYFANKGTMMPPLELGIDLNQELLEELNEAARKLKVSRQALIRRFIRLGLDQYQATLRVRKAG
jgi:hypothetical protein